MNNWDNCVNRFTDLLVPFLRGDLKAWGNVGEFVSECLASSWQPFEVADMLGVAVFPALEKTGGVGTHGLRCLCGLSQRDFAIRTHVPLSTVRNWDSRKSCPLYVYLAFWEILCAESIRCMIYEKINYVF